ncbi:MAG: copper amine oxidase N-terminal domain-containing protein [Oscillospiraceae bacterium]|nr:copper amine oxidase N-terminal domain-containing protein [Oscillospiraceae bacterium]
MKTKKNAALCTLALLALLTGLVFGSCEKPDIYALAENLLGDEGTYSFTADLSVKIKNNSNKSVPGELIFKIEGRAKNGSAEFDVALVEAGGEAVEFHTAVYKQNGVLWFEKGDLPKIIMDLLCTTGMVEWPVMEVFENLTDYEDAVLYVELDGFDLGAFEQYSAQISDTFTIKSNVVYDRSKDFEIPEYEWGDGLSFAKIRNVMEKELLKLPWYRYSELYVILETAEDGANYINVLASRERGDREVLEKLKIDSDLSKVREKPESVYYENILPMRYLMELLGESVGWDAEKKTAYIVKGGNRIYYEGELINSTAYIPLNHFIARTDYIVNSVHAGQYIEFKISRR